MTLGQSIAETRKRLEPHYSDGEARALVREILFRDRKSTRLNSSH